MVTSSSHELQLGRFKLTVTNGSNQERKILASQTAEQELQSIRKSLLKSRSLFILTSFRLNFILEITKLMYQFAKLTSQTSSRPVITKAQGVSNMPLENDNPNSDAFGMYPIVSQTVEAQRLAAKPRGL
jgi:hypothetical protein